MRRICINDIRTHREVQGAGVRTVSLSIGLAICLLVALSGCFASSADDAQAPISEPTPADGSQSEPLSIVAVGDSLTEGLGVATTEAYPAQLENRLRADGYQVEVINAGSSGETSAGALARIDWILRLEPDIVILATGGNDGLRGLDPTATMQNIAEIIDRVEAANIVLVVAGMQAPDNMGSEYTSEFESVFTTLSERYDLLLMPFLLEEVAANPDLNQADAIHPTAAGYATVVEHLYPYVLEAIGQLSSRSRRK